MATDNSAFLHAAQRQHHEDLVARAELAIRKLERTGIQVTFPAVASAPGASRAFLHKTSDLRQAVDRLRATNQPAAISVAPSQRRRDASKDAIITRLQQEYRELRERNRELAQQNAALLGRLRAGHRLN